MGFKGTSCCSATIDTLNEQNCFQGIDIEGNRMSERGGMHPNVQSYRNKDNRPRDQRTADSNNGQYSNDYIDD